MISDVYSYYLSQYATRPTSKYDSHKRSELKNVYNKMVSVNRTSPLYKINLNADMQKMAIDIKESAMELKDFSTELEELGQNPQDAKQKADSSEPDMIGAKFIGSEKLPVDSFEVEVKQLATPQINTGNYLQPRMKPLDAGTYSFDAEIGDVTYELQFDVKPQDTVKDIQEKITKLINKSNIGLKAEVLTDSLGNTALNIESDATGTHGMKPYIFNISDENSSYAKGAVEALGLDRVVQMPSNAVFSVDGNTRTSANNSFTINKSVELELKQVTEEPITIKISEDTKAAVQDINNFVDGYNRMIQFAQKTAEKFQGGGKLLSEFQRITNYYMGVLKENGIKIQDDGMLALDEESSIDLSDKDGVASVLSNLEGFRSSVARRTDSMITNPMEYLDKKVVAYKNPAKSFTSPYSSSAYAGIMFDGYY